MREKNQFELGSAACARETFGAMEINLVGEGKAEWKNKEGGEQRAQPRSGGVRARFGMRWLLQEEPRDN